MLLKEAFILIEGSGHRDEEPANGSARGVDQNDEHHRADSNFRSDRSAGRSDEALHVDSHVSDPKSRHPEVPYLGSQMLRLALQCTLLTLFTFLALIWLDGSSHPAGAPNDSQLLRIHAATQHH